MQNYSFILLFSFVSLIGLGQNSVFGQNAICGGTIPRIDWTSDQERVWKNKITDTTKVHVFGYIKDNITPKEGQTRELPFVDVNLIIGEDTLKTNTDVNGHFYFISCEAGLYKAVFTILDYKYAESIELKRGFVEQVKVVFDFKNYNHSVEVTSIDYSYIDFDNLMNYYPH